MGEPVAAFYRVQIQWHLRRFLRRSGCAHGHPTLIHILAMVILAAMEERGILTGMAVGMISLVWVIMVVGVVVAPCGTTETWKALLETDVQSRRSFFLSTAMRAV